MDKTIQPAQVEMNKGKLTVLLRQASLRAAQKEEQIEQPRTQSHDYGLSLKTS